MPLKLDRTKALYFLAFALPLFYAFYTEHMWEDFFIMFRHSKNLAEGNGLTFNPGVDRVHGFTSPLATLLLALFYFVTGKTSYLPALWCFRILSAAVFAGAAVNLYKLTKDNAGLALAAPLVFFFFALDIKALAFSSNGMETAFTLFFLSSSILQLTGNTSKNILWGGLSFAGLMWTRPDGCIYIATLSLTTLLFFPNRKEKIKALFKMGLICAAVYLPWFLWANWYFGSPIPQPVRAKQASFDLSLITSGQIFPLILNRAEMIFYPIYSQFGGWPWWMQKLVRPQVFFCLFYWAIPTSDRIGRQMSLCFLFLCFYLSGIYPFPWYLPAAAVFAWLTLALGIVSLYDWAKKKVGIFSSLPFICLLLLVAFNLLYLGAETAKAMKIQQAEIEMGTRRQIGLWLKENMKENETVYAECIGYIGYFSDRYVLDYPGLVSPKVASLRKEKNLDMLGLIEPLKPNWVVLRGGVENNKEYGEYFNAHYSAAKTFDATNQLNQLSPFPGRGYADLDSKFTLYRRASN